MFARSGKFPYIAQDMCHPATCIIKDFGCTFSTFYLLFRPLDHREMQFGKIRYFCGPVIHLEIDIQMIVAVPGSIDRITP